MADDRRTPQQARWHYASPRSEVPVPNPLAPPREGSVVYSREYYLNCLPCGHNVSERVNAPDGQSYHCKACEYERKAR